VERIANILVQVEEKISGIEDKVEGLLHSDTNKGEKM
jgi:hypothetical protein